ncbi:hypothetical protein [Kineococcus sp. SYSU DK003]|uniref:hypothetical protein n=1 Tax=Kineococcus sp. SYSU DK003 TaxID=3383124 RepID=UPI003D7C7B58
MTDPATAPNTPQNTQGRWLGWVAAVVGIGAVGVLVYIATLLVGSARDSRAVEEAARNLPDVGTYQLTGDELTQRPDEQWEITATTAEVGEQEVRVNLTWTNTSEQTLEWACPGPVELERWQSASVEVSGAGAAGSSSHCTRDDPDAQQVAPGASVQDWQAFPRGGAWGAGATRLTALEAQDGEDSSDLGNVDTEPDVTFVVDLGSATRAS